MRVTGFSLGLRQTKLVCPILLLLFVGAILTALLPSAEDRGPLGVMAAVRRVSPPRENQAWKHGSDSTEKEQRFTIIIQTYNRTDVLLRVLNHYQAVPHLHQIIIVWNNVGEQTPLTLWNSLGPHPVPVVFKEQASNLMRNRLQPFPEIVTDAVLMLDDDILLSVPDISFAFSVWKQFSEQIVGFVPRKHILTSRGVYSYGSFELQDPETAGGDRYSMVLIGAAFFHRRYLQLFQDLPQSVHELVDETQNCDDIAMNFAVAVHLKEMGSLNKPSGVFVKPVDLRNLEKEASSGYQGMWHRPEHHLQRSYCLNKLTKIYGFMPLRFSNLMVSQLGFPTYANHMSRG